MVFTSCSGKIEILLELRWGPQGTSSVASGKSSLLLSYEEDCGIALQSLQGNWVSSHIEGGILWCFSNCSGKFWVPLEL